MSPGAVVQLVSRQAACIVIAIGSVLRRPWAAEKRVRKVWFVQHIGGRPSLLMLGYPEPPNQVDGGWAPTCEEMQRVNACLHVSYPSALCSSWVVLTVH